MSDAAVTAIVAGMVNICGMVIGFLTLWVKLRDADAKAGEAVIRADVVEKKLDSNTRMTESVEHKADTIVSQTNGAMDQLRLLVERMAERVSKLEEYNRDSSHRLFDAINAVHLKVAEMSLPKITTVVATTPDQSSPEGPK